MSDEIVIKVDSVSKTFRLPHEKHASLKSLVINLGRGLTYEKQKVLNDISFEVKKGEFFGIVGRNGSGKSTMLKLLAGIYRPSKGSIAVNGKLTPFIELGVGFNPELTGRENVFLNGALLGFNRKEMNAMYDDIVEFAEIERFMDQKLKNYSSGMQVRLAFSIAIRAETDILVLDEVLAVGDEAFQQKCIDVFEKYKSKHQTIVLVTHDMEMIKRFCTKAILISDGQLKTSGDPRLVAAEYTKLNQERTDKTIRIDNERLEDSPIRLDIKDNSGDGSTNFNMFEDMEVDISWPKEFKGVKNVGLAIYKNSGEYIFGDNTFGEKQKPSTNKIHYKVNLNLGPGNYHLVAGLFGSSSKDVIQLVGTGPAFVVKGNKEDMTEGLVRLKSEWSK